MVTEACKGFLGPDKDWPSSAKAEGSLTASPTHRGCRSTNKSYSRDNREVVVCSKGWFVRPLKQYFDPYPVWVLEH
ncbi:hypothetical protein ES288_D08G091800v1 [Gossypium darwinii]|uniref:Uncharacterized protein n=1 Tax=Gossypium darwinii TaxID=34276 RepID=A0A5D2BI92_GOSDA|nr:hypothetical protein ES288_D08G091800v1 [Gossypium darwinii]